MTYEKAIDYVLGGAILRNPSKDRELRTMIIEALEKQIPKKPVGDLHSVPHHRCPNCKKAIRIYVDAPYNPFCCFCGQAIDWGADEE